MAKNEEAISNYLKVILGDDMEPNIVRYALVI